MRIAPPILIVCQLGAKVISLQLPYLSTANLASGRTPPEAFLEDEVKIRRYRSTSCRDPREYSSLMMVS